MGISVSRGTESDVDSLASLWMSMVEHHRGLVGERWPVRPGQHAWELRQAQYRRWLSDGTGLLFVARGDGIAFPVGYAFCVLSQSGPTFDLGEMRADVDSLVVSEDARSGGIGTRLLDACRAELRRRDIRYWSIGVVDANEEAIALYERLGFRAFTRSLMATTD
jgi:ribosomal protein S18 acetylase RimI-like enzyme